jgi:uncharacterized integral membrane protein (TIGR00697 family)
MNELLFSAHVLAVTAFALGALHFGKHTLVGWIVAQALLANLFVLKEITLFGMEVTASDVFSVGALFGLNLLQEYFGKEAAQKTVWASFYLLLFFALMSVFHLLYTPSIHDGTQGAYSAILSCTPRLAFASMASAWASQSMDVWIFRLLTTRTSLSLPLRGGCSSCCSQALDTLLFTFLGLAGHIASPMDVFCLSFAVKFIVIAMMAPGMLLARKVVPA